MSRTLETWLLKRWYGPKRLGTYLLMPLSGLFCVLSWLRRQSLQRQQVHHPVPVIVVGNITVGGTGKTPLVIWLVQQLQQAGLKPGVVSRGFGSRGKAGIVAADDNPTEVGDEPLLIVQRTGVPLCVNRDRNQAVSTLLSQYHCDVIIADDGLQHYRLGRDLEIAVVDGQRRFGNGWCLPAGPLREPIKRLQQCDYVIINGESMQLQGDTLLPLDSDRSAMSLHQLQGQTVHVVTGIGNPQRFIQTLQQAGLKPVLHAYPDHHAFSGVELRFADDLPILMTEKDAVKCRRFATPHCWYLPVNAMLEPALAAALLKHIQGLKHG